MKLTAIILLSGILTFSHPDLDISVEFCAKECEAFRGSQGAVETMQIYHRKWNIGVFEGTRFSVHPVKLEEELTENYADKAYEPLGPVVMGAVVEESVDSIFLPSVYQVRNVKIIKGTQVTNVKEIASYEGLYSDMAEIGETILVKGKLEEVLNMKTKEKYHRVLVGSPEGKDKEYIKVV